MKRAIIQVDVAVIGGSLGGVMAAYRAAQQGKRVYLCEECTWIGGQLTAQAVPPDEHQWIESFGCTATYRAFRNDLRAFYRNHFPIRTDAPPPPNWNMGGAWVSRIAHEPLVAHHLLQQLLLPYLCNGRILLQTQTKAISCEMVGNQIASTRVEHLTDGTQTTISASLFIDATDIGQLLPLCGAEFVTGAESYAQTGEPHAPKQSDPMDLQPVTWVAALAYEPGTDNTIPKPARYDEFASLKQPYDQYPVFSWYGPDSETGKAKRFTLFDHDPDADQLLPLWSYRRIIDPSYFEPGFYAAEVSLLNWPQNDYFLGNLFDCEEAEKHWDLAKQWTLSFVYWLQTNGYPALRLCPEVLGTTDGLAQYPYIRESRRIQALYTVREQDINADLRDTPVVYPDSVGIGCYHIDLHMTTRSHTFAYYPSWPFEIPLGAMIPIRIENLIAGCKNIGTTHLTNGCFRLHPVEWNIGEVAGLLSSYALDQQRTPKQIWENPDQLHAFQAILDHHGIERHWDKTKITKI